MVAFKAWKQKQKKLSKVISYHLQHRPQKGRKTYEQLRKVRAANQAAKALKQIHSS